MSYQKYNPELFSLQRLANNAWRTIPAATFTWSSDYTLADHTKGLPPSPINTLVIGSETATITLSRWDTQGDRVFAGDKVRARYNGRLIFLGTVHSVQITTTADPAARRYGASRRVDIAAECGGLYADLLSRTVTWESLPQQLWIDRIRMPVFGLTIVGW
jgi:hypothetical protein